MIEFPTKYKSLNRQVYTRDKYSIIPIRYADRYKIMNWRNEQLFHLRQDSILTKEEQDNYFDKVLSKIFDVPNPNQILFSYLENGICLGYGGLVHINWKDRNAEISFLLFL